MVPFGVNTVRRSFVTSIRGQPDEWTPIKYYIGMEDYIELTTSGPYELPHDGFCAIIPNFDLSILYMYVSLQRRAPAS